MKKTNLTFIYVLLFAFCTFAQKDVKLKDGRTITLYNNGTWDFKSVPDQEITTPQGDKLLIYSNKTWKEKPGPPQFGSMKDTRDNKTYKTVKIGTQWWMAENLAYKTGSGSWAYNNEESNVAKYGRLYHWETAKTACPTGWHLPSDAEWTTLTSYLDGESVAGGKMKTTSNWDSPNIGATNESGFSSLPVGLLTNDGGFYEVGSSGYFWSSTQSSTKLYVVTRPELQ